MEAECRGCACFALKAFQGLRIAGNSVGQEFQGDEAFEPGVFGFVHDTHPARAEKFDNLVWAEPGS
jgi:hypothetical protein